MHRIIRLLALSALLGGWTAASALAQGSALGARAGVGRASVSSTEFAFTAGSVTSFQGGVFFSFFTPGRLIVQPEAVYARRGFSALVLGGGQADANISYIEIPLLFKFRLTEETNRLRPAAILGTFVAFEVGCSLTGDTEELGSSECDSIIDGRGEMDAGILLGAGVNYGLTGRWFLTGDLRYSIGLMNISWEETDDNVSSRGWALTAGAGVFLGR